MTQVESDSPRRSRRSASKGSHANRPHGLPPLALPPMGSAPDPYGSDRRGGSNPARLGGDPRYAGPGRLDDQTRPLPGPAPHDLPGSATGGLTGGPAGPGGRAPGGFDGGTGGGTPFAALTLPPEGDHRGRHATPFGQGFGWVITWTLVSALVPGAGLVAAGRRKLGGFVLFVQLLIGLALVGLATQGNPLKRAANLIVNPTSLLIAGGVALLIALGWLAAVVGTNARLRRYASLTRPQKLFSGVLVLALVSAIALPTYKIGEAAVLQRDLLNSDVFGAAVGFGKSPEGAEADPWADTPRINTLLIGSDAGADRTSTRPDTLILTTTDTKSGNTVMFSLPRNLGHAQFPLGSPGARRWPEGFWCPNPNSGLNDCLINAVWVWAESDEGKQYYTGKNPGLTATRDVVSGSLGIPVDQYVLLNIQGLVDFVDAIGGVRMDVDKDLPRGGLRNAVPGTFAYTQPTQGYLKAGKNKLLNGYNAMWYARSRRQSTDYDRMRRQRCLIAAISDQSDPVKVGLAFPKIAKAIKSNLSTSIALGDLSAWVELATRIQKGKLTSLAFTDEVLTSRDNPDYAQIQSLVQKSIRDSVKPAAPKPTASAGSTPSASPSPGTKKPVDPTKAQNVKDLC